MFAIGLSKTKLGYDGAGNSKTECPELTGKVEQKGKRNMLNGYL